jgi:hypothetical protein
MGTGNGNGAGIGGDAQMSTLVGDTGTNMCVLAWILPITVPEIRVHMADAIQGRYIRPRPAAAVFRGSRGYRRRYRLFDQLAGTAAASVVGYALVCSFKAVAACLAWGSEARLLVSHRLASRLGYRHLSP